MSKTKNRTKTEALTVLVQSRDDAALQIKRIGDLQRDIERIQADHNDQVAVLQKAAVEAVAPIKAEIEEIELGVQAWATANRDALTDGGKVKFADLTTGFIRWRNNPPKCSVTGMDAVLALLEANPDLARFVRVKKEVNKEAFLNEAEFLEANPIPGVKIVQGKEFFVIEPNNQELT